MKLAFLGSPDFSAKVLKDLVRYTHEHKHTIEFIVTQPDRLVGRKKVLTATPVKEMGLESKIPVYYDLSIFKEQAVDLAILFAYGNIIPEWTLTKPTYGFWNIHPSLLPDFRGASPTVYPILLGRTETGTTLMKMDKELDHGDIIDQNNTHILPDDTQTTLLDRLVILSTSILLKNLENIHSITAEKQKHESATFTRPLTRDDGYIAPKIIRMAIENNTNTVTELPQIYNDWITRNPSQKQIQLNARETLLNMYRALSGWPGIWTLTEIKGIQKRVKILGVKTKNQTIEINKIQIEGKAPTEITSFNI